MLLILHTDPETGSAAITTPCAPREDGESDLAYLGRIVSRMKEAGSMPKDAAWSTVHPDNVPADRSFRNAWEVGTEAQHIVTNIPKAQEITRNRLRRERAPLLAELDAQYLKALESKDEARQAAVVAEKQRLRDLPATVDGVTDLESLKALKAAK